MRSKDLSGSLLGDAVGEGELEALGDELFDVWAADIGSLLNLDDLEDLLRVVSIMIPTTIESVIRT